MDANAHADNVFTTNIVSEMQAKVEQLSTLMFTSLGIIHRSAPIEEISAEHKSDEIEIKTVDSGSLMSKRIDVWANTISGINLDLDKLIQKLPNIAIKDLNKLSASDSEEIMQIHEQNSQLGVELQKCLENAEAAEISLSKTIDILAKHQIDCLKQDAIEETKKA